MIRIIAIVMLLATISSAAEETKPDLKQFANNYFSKMVASQAPDASAKALEEYLSLLTDDVGHTHLPWQTDASRLADGKASMREGMTFYLGAHTEYDAELLNVFVFNDSAIAIRYIHSAKGIDPQTKQAIEYTSTMMEVLEMEGDKIAVIRKYHE